jgi:anti-sigma factor RsiW
MMNDTQWLERELARQLAPVAAPPGLWDRVQNPRRPLRWSAWPAFALATMLITAGVFWKVDAARPPRDFASIRKWVKAQADIDIDLPEKTPASVRILGVRMLRVQGLPTAAIDYVANGDVATLMVSGKNPALDDDSGTSRHVLTSIQEGDTRLVSWNMRNESYTLTDSHGACLLCH